MNWQNEFCLFVLPPHSKLGEREDLREEKSAVTGCTLCPILRIKPLHTR